MARYPRLSALAFCLLAHATVHGQDAVATDATEPAASTPRYFAAVRAELERLALAPECESLDPLRGRCSFRHRTADAERALDVHVLVDGGTDTVYLYVARVLVASPDDASTEPLLRRIAALNWRLLAAKLEWNPSDGEVRLSAVMHTDTNFDRMAFRRLARLVPRQAEQYARELDTLVAP